MQHNTSPDVHTDETQEFRFAILLKYCTGTGTLCWNRVEYIKWKCKINEKWKCNNK